MITIEPAQSAQFPRLIAIWESSVRATHTFLQENDIVSLRSLLLETYLPALQVIVARDNSCEPIGFVGVSGHRIEMLFVDARSRGKGAGRALLVYAMEKLQADELDVNEQNPQGVSFYRHMGFVQTGRSEIDGQGNAFPLLHMKYFR